VHGEAALLAHVLRGDADDAVELGLAHEPVDAHVRAQQRRHLPGRGVM
jgi:hypothetical protein